MNTTEFIIHDWKEGEKIYTFTFASMLGIYFPVEIIETEYKIGRYEYLKYCCNDLFFTYSDAEFEFNNRRNHAKSRCDRKINELMQEIQNIRNTMSFYKLT